ncbi:MAG: hypothetical protein EXR99_12135 [Gemmataceae bacterium]|nr:hypothetical protein [Gemmataceae bacterium]
MSQENPGILPGQLTRARIYLIAASLLWSTSGFFTRLLQSTKSEGELETIHPTQMACFRALFAALGMTVWLRRGDFTFRPPMVPTVMSFAAMNILFVTALALGSAANAILLQYTALIWFIVFSIYFLKEKPDTKAIQALAPGLLGIVIMVAGGWNAGEGPIIAIALGSGLAYAGVIIGIRHMRDVAPPWITFCNHLVAGLILVPFIWQWPMPSSKQLLILFVWGVFQMGVPYLLAAKSLKVISPQEAGILTLLEPVFNPIWAYLIAPEREVPTLSTIVGGVFLLSALLWRFWPFGKKANGDLSAR